MYPGNPIVERGKDPSQLYRLIGRFGIALALVIAAGCTQDMADQPRYEPLEAADASVSNALSRTVIAGTVPRGQLRIDEHYYTGKVAGQLADAFPEPLTEAMLLRGQNRYNIFCAVCHDRVGNGQGMVVRRGFPRPPSYHIDRLRAAPVGHFFDVITNGFGRMPDHAAQISPADRWAIVAYVRALQLSQRIHRDNLSADDLKQLADATND